MTVSEIVTMIAAIAALGISIYKSRSEVASNSGDAAESYAAAAKTYAVEVKALRNEILDLRKKDEVRERQLRKLSEENANLRDWAERLCCQVNELGGTPVPLKEDEVENG